jgi:sialate O-acetylesterase
LFFYVDAHATIVLPSFFNNNMVLQQQSSVAIWGSANKNTTIKIKSTWDNKTYSTSSDELGNWKTHINTCKAGGPYKIIISDNEQLEINNILIGEVWFCAGQSNMEMPMRGFKNQPVLNSNEMLLDADNNNLRLFQTERNATSSPQYNAKGTWKISDAESAKEFSAVAYMYGSMLQKKLQVPVGIIVSSWAGTKIQSWMSKPSLKNLIDNEMLASVDSAVEKHKQPTSLYNGMIAPFVGYGIKGFLWYQGESNRHESDTYAKLFPAMVADWRKSWNNDANLPFYYVQIAPYGGKDSTRSNRALREVQMKAMNEISDCGMAVTMDIGDETYIHFPDKKTVSQRLLYWALAKTYGYKGISFSGPIYNSITINKNKISVSFQFAENGLTSFGKELMNFEVAGSDKIFHLAKAKIEEDKTVSVWSDDVKEPVAVRYAYKEYVKGDLYNTAGLPASSFRSDNW